MVFCMVWRRRYRGGEQSVYSAALVYFCVLCLVACMALCVMLCDYHPDMPHLSFSPSIACNTVSKSA
jgi:hypothetical protein